MNLFSIFGHSIWFMGLNIFMLEIKKWKVIRCDPTQIYITFFKYLLSVLNSKIMLPSFKKLNGFCTTSQNFINYSINLHRKFNASMCNNSEKENQCNLVRWTTLMLCDISLLFSIFISCFEFLKEICTY